MLFGYDLFLSGDVFYVQTVLVTAEVDCVISVTIYEMESLFVFFLSISLFVAAAVFYITG